GFASAGVVENKSSVVMASAIRRLEINLTNWLPGELGVTY
ncbi:MAG: hypothetical protein RL256_942, partial [Actinomycetota bacterium]